MCGIVGAVGVKFSPSVLASLRHRGPDGHGVVQFQCSGQSLWLGHTRLAILDLSPAGHQPMQSRDGRWWLTFNGEIYNHLELRKKMFSLPSPVPGSKGEAHWRGHSDSETLVELIAAHGVEKALPLLNGMFAFAALDLQECKLFLARDPFGIKPLYYWRRGSRLAFASEVKALRALGVAGGVDRVGLQQFLALRYVPSPGTLWEGVRRLPPGHVACIELASGEHRISPFIFPTQEKFSGTFDDAVAVYQEQFSSAVKRQLLADVPVGVLLSGGVDSALLAAMAKEVGHELPCFTVGFGAQHGECEIVDAERTARVLGLPFHAVIVSPNNMREALPQIVRAVEEPLGTTSVMPMWYLVRRARQDVTVVLTGQGSDEPWGGYFRYQVELLRNWMPWPLGWRIMKALLAPWHGKPEWLARGLATLAEHEVARQMLAACALFSTRERQLLLGDSEDGVAESVFLNWLAWLENAPGLTGVNRMMRLDSRMNLADDLLLYGDKISMAVSMEARVPMLDIELVRFVESLPIDYRIRWRRGKLVHKAMAERFLPREIICRRKKGFQVPFEAWSRGTWRKWVEDRLLDGLKGLLRFEGVKKLWQEHLAGKPGRSRQMFALLMLSLWWEDNRCGK